MNASEKIAFFVGILMFPKGRDANFSCEKRCVSIVLIAALMLVTKYWQTVEFISW